jgi:hypothetical protein
MVWIGITCPGLALWLEGDLRLFKPQEPDAAAVRPVRVPITAPQQQIEQHKTLMILVTFGRH